MWTTLGHPGQVVADLSLGINGDGRLEVFALTNQQQIWHIWQVSPGGDWAGWSLLSSASVTASAIAVGQNADTRLELFGIDTGGAVLHSWQLAPSADWSDWSDWSPMVNPEPGGGLTVVRSADGRLEIFLTPSNVASNVWHAYQATPNGGWSEWSPLGEPIGLPIGHLRGAQNADGRLELFAMTPSDGVWHIYQSTPGGDWSGWMSLTSAEAPNLEMALGRNIDGRLEVFLLGTNHVSHAWQTVPNDGWSDWNPMTETDPTGTHLAVARNADGRLEAFLISSVGNALHTAQTVANGGWSAWQELDGLTAGGPVSVTQNVDGRLEVFTASPDGDVLHLWQQSANQWRWPGADFVTSPQINPNLGPGLFPTQHADNARSGWFPFETSLNLGNVGDLHLLFTQSLDRLAYTQPLYVAGLTIADAMHNVVVVATENNTTAAFDTESASEPLWLRALIPSDEAPVSSDDIEVAPTSRR